MEGAEPVKKVLPGIEGGSEPPARASRGFLGAITSFFREFKEEMEVVSQDISERADATTSSNVEDCVVRVEQFRNISQDYERLLELSRALEAALQTVIESHNTFASSLERQGKIFADHAMVTGSLEDGVVSEDVKLDTPKDGKESESLVTTASQQKQLSLQLQYLRETVKGFAESITLFNDKVIGDLEESVKTYRRNRLLLDAAERKLISTKEPQEQDKEALASLRAAHDKSKESVDVKLALLNEKRHGDLKKMADILNMTIQNYITESKRALR